MIFSLKDTVRSMYDNAPNNTNEGCVGILKSESLKEEYRTWENQLFLLKGGFGCTPSAIGNACLGTFCVDGEHARMERYQFIGIANEEVTKIAMKKLKTAQENNKKEVI